MGLGGKKKSEPAPEPEPQFRQVSRNDKAEENTEISYGRVKDRAKTNRGAGLLSSDGQSDETTGRKRSQMVRTA